MQISKIGLLVLSQSVRWGRGVSVSPRAAPPSSEAAFPTGMAFGGARGAEVDPTPCDPKAFEHKEYDVLVFGFGGQMAEAFLRNLDAAKPSEKMKVALVVRKDLQALEYQWALNYGPNALKHPPMFEIDIVQNPEKMLEVTNKSRVVLNLASPSEATGAESVVSAAVRGCAHYVDISTETKLARIVYDHYHLQAAARQLAIVQAAGFDAVASDLLAMTAARDLEMSGHEVPTHVMVIWQLVNTMRYIAKEQAEQAAFQHYGPVMDPYILAPEVPIALRVDSTPSGYMPADSLIFKPLLPQPVQHYMRSTSDCPVIRRSMHSQYRGSAISVQEVCATSLLPSLASFRQNKSNPATQPSQLGQPVAKSLQPNPDELAAGSFMGTAIAVRRPNATEGKKSVPWTRVVMEGLGDAHYLGTPQIVLQVVQSLVFDGPKQFGYVTPTTALGTETLEKRITQVDGGAFVRMHHGLQ